MLVASPSAAAGVAPAAATGGSGTLTAIGAENEYADVIQQVGGAYVMPRRS